MHEEYEPFGQEWEKEMMRINKNALIGMIRMQHDNLLKKEDRYRSLLKQVKPQMSSDEIGVLYKEISEVLYG